MPHSACILVFMLAVAFRGQSADCCSEVFSVAEVERAARAALSAETPQMARFVFIPRNQPLVGSASDNSNSWYAERAFVAFQSLSIAVMVITPIGASLHHWNHRTRQHTVRILRGEDPLAVEVDGVKLVMISRRGELNLVSLRALSAPEALAATGAMARRLRLSAAGAVVRTDPWVFYPDSLFWGIPATWSETDPAVPARAAEEAWVCYVPSSGEGHCRLVRGT